MSIRTLIASPLIIMFCTSCYFPVPPVEAQRPATVQVTPLPEETELPVVFVMRADEGYASGNSILIYSNGELVGSLSRGSVLVWSAHVGVNEIYGRRGRLKTCFMFNAECIFDKDIPLEPVMSSTGPDTNIITINADNKKNYYILVDMKLLSHHDMMMLVTEEQAGTVKLKAGEKAKLNRYKHQ